jgi:hypothetical protein
MNLLTNIILKLSSLIAKNLPSVLHTGAFLYLAVCTVKVANATESYLPDTQKLSTKAAQSKDLYVEPDFNFQTFSTYTLELSVNGQDGQPAEGVIMRIFSTGDEHALSENEVVSQKSLLGIVRTDQYGSVYQTIEISKSVKQVLLELNSKSPDNQVLIQLADQEYISHAFAVD